MDIGDIVNYGTVAMWVVGAALYIGRLARGEAVIPKWLSIVLGSNLILGLIIALGLAGSAAQAYFHHKGPNVVEKVVEKPVDRIVERTVEKLVPIPCPKPKHLLHGIQVQSGAQVEGVANAPNSMAAGINNGSMELGDVSPKFAKRLVTANVPRYGGFETIFAVQVTSNHTFAMQVTVTGSYVSNFRAIPDGTGKMAVVANMQGKVVGATGGYGSLQNVSTGKYIVTVQTTQPDKVQLEIGN
jgi:hypothetical protein